MTGMSDAPAERAAAVLAAFTDIHDRVFRGDPAANPRLRVEVVGAAMAADTPVLILVTPWTINGLAFPPDAEFPDHLDLAAKTYLVWSHELDGLGLYRMVGLLSSVACLQSPSEARELATAMAEPFRRAVEAVRRGVTAGDAGVPDAGRRHFLQLRAI